MSEVHLLLNVGCSQLWLLGSLSQASAQASRSCSHEHEYRLHEIIGNDAFPAYISPCLTISVFMLLVQENLQEWMLDKRGRDQFVIRYRDQTEIYWNDAARSQVRVLGLTAILARVL